MVRIYTPDNATIIKGSLRNLLDGSRSSSLQHFIDKAETIHQNFFSDYDEYSMNDFLPLYKKGAILLIFNRENYLLNHRRSSDADFIIVNGATVRGYNCNNSNNNEVFHLNQYSINDDSDLADVENFLDSFWRFLPAGWDRTEMCNYYSAAVLAFDPATGALLIPQSLASDICDGDIKDAGFTFFKEGNQVDNETKQPVSSNTQNVNTQTTEIKGNIMSKVTSIVAANKSAAATAAKLEAGKVALTQLTKVAAKALPSGMAGMFAKQYLDTPVGRVVVANLLSLAIEQYAPNNQKARIVAKAAMDAAMLEVVQSFNISEMIDKAIEGINIDALTSNISEE